MSKDVPVYRVVKTAVVDILGEPVGDPAAPATLVSLIKAVLQSVPPAHMVEYLRFGKEIADAISLGGPKTELRLSREAHAWLVDVVEKEKPFRLAAIHEAFVRTMNEYEEHTNG